MLPEEFVSKIQAGKKSFKRSELRDAELTSLDCYSLRLMNCLFENVDFSGACLDDLRCVNCKFVRCNFSQAQLLETSFINSCFYYPSDTGSFHGCDFTRANLRHSSFEACDIRTCNFDRSFLMGSVFEDVNAVGASFYLARFENFVKVNNSNFQYVDLRGANLEKCDLSNTVFSHANLEEASLAEANLVACSLGGATFRYTDLQGADVRGADISSFDVRSMDLTGIKIFESQQRSLLETAGIIIFPDDRV
jgi:fluoroquinolone resistance protein